MANLALEIDSTAMPSCIEILEPRRLLSVSVLTYHYNNSRTGLNSAETALTPANVNPAAFGALFVDSVDGKVDAQPLLVPNLKIPGKGTHNVLFVATENDTLYAFDADSNLGADSAPLWQASLLGPGEVPSDDRGCGQITPTIGITATPVIDRATGVMYVTAMSKLESGGTSTYFQRLWAIDISTGKNKMAPVVVAASIPSTGPNSSNGTLSFDAANYAERAALTLVNGTVYTTWTSHCDSFTYNGWVIGYSAATLRQKAVLCTTPNGTEGSFWGSGAGPAVDSAGNLFTLEANGTFDSTLSASGFPSQGDFGGSFIKISTARRLAVSDYFAPSFVNAENAMDEDLGSGGVMVLNIRDAHGDLHHLAIGAGKDGNIYLVNRDNMGKYNPGTDDAIYQEIDNALPGGEWATSAYFNGSVYYGPVGGHLLQFKFDNSARLNASPASQSANTFDYPGTTPTVSSHGNANGIVWAAEAAPDGQAVLHAYNAANLSQELYNSEMEGARDAFGVNNKFITPVVANGKVYVATTNGVGVFGLLNATPARAG